MPNHMDGAIVALGYGPDDAVCAAFERRLIWHGHDKRILQREAGTTNWDDAARFLFGSPVRELTVDRSAGTTQHGEPTAILSDP